MQLSWVLELPSGTRVRIKPAVPATPSTCAHRAKARAGACARDRANGESRALPWGATLGRWRVQGPATRQEGLGQEGRGSAGRTPL
eukprot:6572233-Prymnesium_polylepis.2